MSLTQTWAPFFTSSARQEGRAVHGAGQVSHLPTDAPEQRLQVADAVVSLQGEGESLSAECTCAEYADGQYCHHIWAAMLDHQEAGRTFAPAAETALEPALPRLPKARRRSPGQKPVPRTKVDWDERLDFVRLAHDPDESRSSTLTPTVASVCYVIRADLCRRIGSLLIELKERDDETASVRPLRLQTSGLPVLADATDRELCGLILGSRGLDEDTLGEGVLAAKPRGIFDVREGARHVILRRMGTTGRCWVQGKDGGLAGPLVWAAKQAWKLWLVGRSRPVGGEGLEIYLELRSGRTRLAIDAPAILVGGIDGFLVHDNRITAFDDVGAFNWVRHFRDETDGRDGKIRVEAEDAPAFLERLYRMPQLPLVDFPPAWSLPERSVKAIPGLDLADDIGKESPAGNARAVTASVFFGYGPARISPDMPGRFLHVEESDPGGEESSVLVRRDREGERSAVAHLLDLGFRPEREGRAESLQVPPDRLNAALASLLAEGWLVRSEGRPVRRPQPLQASIRSGIDWFELRGDVRYPTESGEEQLNLPDILSAASGSRRFVSLGDGSLGILPGAWLEGHRLLTSTGQIDGDCLRFDRSQVALLDALLSHETGADIDQRFREARDRLRRFEGIEAVGADDSFKGQLRSYQQEGLGWLTFLQWLGMGGILADDMGLGKTIQILAMLDRSRSRPEDTNGGTQSGRASLVVAPKSVVFNWLDEAERFTPNLRVLHYAGADREPLRQLFPEHDLIVTSYGLLRRDIAELREHAFRFAILDEAQAIKNASSQLAKSARLLQARHRLALTGTPVENHLGDLWSILEFVNPGFLGSGRRFSELVRGGVRNPGRVEAARQVSQALRPFILRRTKDQVLTELPPKTEQTIVCEMEADQRKVYEELRRHYRRTLLSASEPTASGGRAGQTMAVLEALLRLRQACCHPALIDPGRTDVGSAKLEALMEQLVELISEGHKALVFSQFTSMLRLVRDRLDAEGFVYEYLDGQTRDRKRHVRRFQNDPDCPLFLISLKAGGQGLNLTAAQYVFILDPWWNPAVEAQAIDRVHRIGQDRAVTAYRLICRDTIEQRIVELQEHKRQLADAIVGEQENLLRNLSRDDLEILLG